MNGSDEYNHEEDEEPEVKYSYTFSVHNPSSDFFPSTGVPGGEGCPSSRFSVLYLSDDDDDNDDSSVDDCSVLRIFV